MPIIHTPKSFVLSVSLLTLVGVLLHDTQLDKATVTALGLPAVVVAYGAFDAAAKFGDGHTHSEIVSFGNRGAKAQTTTGATPRFHGDKKYLLQRKVAKSLTIGGGYAFPVA